MNYLDPSQSQLQHALGVKLSNENMTASQRKAKTINEQFDPLISSLLNVANASKRGLIAKKVVRAILCAGIPKTDTLWYLCEKNHHTLALELYSNGGFDG